MLAIELKNETNSMFSQDVAVKILMEQDFHPERFREFMREVSWIVLMLFDFVILPPSQNICSC
jgi:hypothetical protein